MSAHFSIILMFLNGEADKRFLKNSFYSVFVDKIYKFYIQFTLYIVSVRLLHTGDILEQMV